MSWRAPSLVAPERPRFSGPATWARALPAGLAHEALPSAIAAAGIGALLLWLAPPGTDFAAHAYQRALFLHHGYALWDDRWYAGRYSFVGYSVLYYPLAAWIGIRVLAVASVAVAAHAFAVVASREWGSAARWSSRSFAVLWAGFVLTGAFPFALGVAFALLALRALQSGRRPLFAALTLLTLAASPVALVLLVVVLAGAALERRRWTPGPVVALAAAVAIELLLLRLFPGTGRYPFPLSEAGAALGFCAVGIALTWRVEEARVLRFVFAVYAVAVAAVYLVPSGLGENVTRLRYVALPLALLVLALRRWRPWPLAVAVAALALGWNATPLAAGWRRGSQDVTRRAAVWKAPLAYLDGHLRPGFRVEAVDTSAHWPAFYLPEAGIPIVRGWFRQADFPQNALLYRSRLTRSAYLRWLHDLGVAYVVLADAPPDYSSRREAALVRSGRAGLRPVFRSRDVTVYAVPRPRPIATGPGAARVLALGGSRLVVRVARAGTYRVAVHWSPYWRASSGCLARSSDGMLELVARDAGTVRIAFRVDAGSLWHALAGTAPRCRIAG